jgi:hypothetical protein
LAAPKRPPEWIRVDRLLGEHGGLRETAVGRARFERQMVTRRLEKPNEDEVRGVRRGWCLGGKEFRDEMLQKADGKLGEHRSGDLPLESGNAKAGRIVREDLRRLCWVESDLSRRPKNDPAKLTLAARLRPETTLTIKEIAARVKLGASKSANARLHARMKNPAPEKKAVQAQRQNEPC